MSRLMVVLALALCLAPALVFGQFGRVGDVFLLHHSLFKVAGAGGTFTAQVNNFTAAPTKLTGQTLEVGTNYTFIFSADTDWVTHPLVFTNDTAGGLGALEPQIDRSVPVGPFPNLGAALNANFTFSFVISTNLLGKTLFVQSPDRAGEGFGFNLVVQAAPFLNGGAAAAADVAIPNPTFGRGGDNFVVHHSLFLVPGAGSVTFSVNGGAIAKPAGQTLEGGTRYNFVFSPDTNWTDHSVFFTSDPLGGINPETAIANIPLGPFPTGGAAGAGTGISFVIPTVLIGSTLWVQGNRAGEGSPIKIVSQVPPYVPGGGAAFQDPVPFPAAIPLAVAVSSSSSSSSSTAGAGSAKGNGADSAAPLAFASIVALSLALATASKYL